MEKTPQAKKLAKIKLLEEKKRIREGLPHLHGFKMYPWMREYFESTNRVNLVCSANQIGKDLQEDTEIPTRTGFKKIKDIKVGDFVYDMHGKAVRVNAIPFEGEQNGYELTFNDGSKVICGEFHDWFCLSGANRFKRKLNEWTVRNTITIVSQGGYKPKTRASRAYSFPVAQPTPTAVNKSLLDPYAVGYIIGNGGLTDGTAKVTINKLDVDIVEYFKSNISIKRISKGITYSMPCKIRNWLWGYGLKGKSATKRIPNEYLHSSIEQKKELLAGLMDSDGTVSPDGHTSYSTSSPGLAKDFAQLVTSLGGIAQIKKRKAGYKKNGKHIKCLDSYLISVWVKFNPFKLCERKKTRWIPHNRDKHQRILWEARPVGKIKSRCISVDGDGSFLCTRNYLVTHNSSIQHRKLIHWATDKTLWKKLWPHMEHPRQFWLLYPSSYVATIEFEKKIKVESLPRNDFKNDPVYGWEAEYRSKYIQAIHFHNGLSVYFKTYSQDPQDLQSGSAAAIWLDEEVPAELIPELQARLFATNGYLNAVFTPTLGQEYWREALEVRGPKERFPDALKTQVSMYDCLTYEDGSPSFWTRERIEQIKRMCKSDAEIQRRVYGRFVLDSGLRYPGFNPEVNVIEPVPIPADWLVYVGVDSGSGGKHNHPAAITCTAVSPDFRRGYVFKGKRLDGMTTTASDLVFMTMELTQGIKNPIMGVYYDFSAHDLKEISARMGTQWIPAEKSHLIGEQVINVGFKNQILSIFNTVDLEPLVIELKSLKISTAKTMAVDDFVDSFRYSVSKVPWDWSALTEKPEAPRLPKSELDKRREWVLYNPEDEFNNSIESEMNEWDGLMGSEWYG